VPRTCLPDGSECGVEGASSGEGGGSARRQRVLCWCVRAVLKEALLDGHIEGGDDGGGYCPRRMDEIRRHRNRDAWCRSG
jgi:hypothetical protein